MVYAYICTIYCLLLATCYTICRNHEYDTRSPRLVACVRCSAVSLTARQLIFKHEIERHTTLHYY